MNDPTELTLNTLIVDGILEFIQSIKVIAVVNKNLAKLHLIHIFIPAKKKWISLWIFHPEDDISFQFQWLTLSLFISNC